MNKNVSRFNVIIRCSSWGAGIGFFLGIIYFFFYGLWAYSILGLFVNVIVGWMLGILNGFALGQLYSRIKDVKSIKLTSLALSIFVTSVSSYIMYYVIFSPLSGEAQRTLIIPLPAVIIATVIAAVLSQPLLTWYSNTENLTQG